MMTDPTVVRVVIIDDARDYRYLIRVVLEREGTYQVVGEASNGLDGLAEVRKHAPGLVLLDVSMPTTDGFQVLPRVRTVCPDAAVVMLSVFAPNTPRDDGSLADHARALGADGYIQKGQRLTVLMSQLRAVVDTRIAGSEHD